MKAIHPRIGLSWLAALAAALAGCSPVIAPGATPTRPAPTLTRVASATRAIVVPTPGAAPPLEIWLPPEFAPSDQTPGGRLLAEQIIQFEAAHPGQPVLIRLKSADGPSGLLAALTAASNVAPTILPDLIALPRDALVEAAAASLVTPLDELIPKAIVDDYYSFAESLGRVDGELVGLPFAADTHILVYNTSAYPQPPRQWSEIVTGTLALPGAEAGSLTLLQVYLTLGGSVTDGDGAVAIDSDRLADALRLVQASQTAGVLTPASASFTDPAAAWQMFRDRRATAAITSVRSFLGEANRVPSARAALIPAEGGLPLALADGWAWAIVNKPTGLHSETLELLQALVEPEAMAAWTLAAHVLPPRASALRGWSGSAHAAFASEVLTRAQLRPPAEVLSRLGGPLRLALTDVLSGQATPQGAARAAAQAIAEP